MIELDRWESQLVYLAKKFPIHETDYVDALKMIWSEKGGMRPEHVNLEYVGEVLVNLLEKVVPDFKLTELLNKLAPVQYGEIQYTDNKTYGERICWVCLYNYLSVLQINSSLPGMSATFPIIGLTPYEPGLLIVKDEDEE